VSAKEVNFDGLVGPTHNYAGLSWGNVASERHRSEIANPRAAALQGLDKMQRLLALGLGQGVLPPHERPHIPSLRTLGFSGTDAQVLAKAAVKAPELLASTGSASAMWTANAATVSSSSDTADGRVHFTPANLNAKYHRSIEHPFTGRVLQAIFNDARHFCVHEALPPCPQFGDEGAANHTRFCVDYGHKGVEFYVYGQVALNDHAPRPQKFPARQTREASEAVARRHGLAPAQCVFAQQNPAVIDAGVFHNDVIAVGNRNVLLYHQDAFLDTDTVLHAINKRLIGAELIPVCISREQMSVADAVSTYLFNSQLITLDSGAMALIVPTESQAFAKTSTVLETLLADAANPITELVTLDLKQSMQNGGGPACLRLRVVLNEQEQAAVKRCMLTPEWLNTLRDWVERHYRDRLSSADLADPALLNESRTALDELSRLLDLGSIYDFQR